jgi:HAD superfamily hydrolase (TIGR01549 family)
MFESVNTIFFDVGNTLYISPEMEKEYPRQLVELLATTRGIDLTEAKAMLSEVSKKYVTKVRAMEDLGFSRPQVHEAFCKVDPRKYLSKDPELVSAMTTLARNYRLGIISNFKQSHLEEILDVLGLSKELFHWFVTEDIVQEIKPAPEPFLKAVEMSAARIDQCLYVGDSPSKDMRPAKEIGMATILVRQNPTKDDLSYTDCSIVDVKQLIELLPRTQSS